MRSMMPRKKSNIKRGLIHLKWKELKDPMRSNSWRNDKGSDRVGRSESIIRVECWPLSPHGWSSSVDDKIQRGANGVESSNGKEEKIIGNEEVSERRNTRRIGYMVTDALHRRRREEKFQVSKTSQHLGKRPRGWIDNSLRRQQTIQVTQ